MTELKRTQHENLQTEFDKIKEANASIMTTGIERKNKDGSVTMKEYAQVNERIKAFRMVHPLGSIQTEIISLENGVVTMQTKVFSKDGRLLGTGYAQEKESSTFINKTSFIENAETSAVGRALGMCGFGIDTSISSAEELQNAMANQEQPKQTKKAGPTKAPMTEEQRTVINGLEDKLKSWLLKKFNIKSLDQLTSEQAAWFIGEMNRKKAKA